MKPYDVLGIGNAIVDILSYVDEEFLLSHDLPKGGMTLVDEKHADALYEKIGASRECSGGSVANSLAGIASLGGRCAYIGKVKSDQLGGIFKHDMHALDIMFETPPNLDGPATARCLVCVTPDAQRTMATYIGACAELSEQDIDNELVEQSAITYVEGYLWDQAAAKRAIDHALELAKSAGNKRAFTLSDPFCVDRHRAEFIPLIKEKVDILFANEQEVLSLFETESLETAINQVRTICPLVAITRSEKGCMIITETEALPIPTSPVADVKDTTGAGDLFAAGFLYGLSKHKTLTESAMLGNACAGEIIQHLGARSMKPLKQLVA